MVRLGNITLDAPFFQAGLAGYSDTAMRLVARRHGCPYCVTEAMLDQFLLNGGKGLAAAGLEPEDHPVAGQLMGSHPREIAAAARVLVGLGYDVIDVNLACPVRKIRRRCRGGHLLSAPDEAIAVLDAVRQAVPAEVPCTVKLRCGSDDSVEAARAFFRIFERVIETGYAGAVVHGRTVRQKYEGPARWSFLRDLVSTYGGQPGFVIGGSGDIWTARDVDAMLRRTGVALVSVARGCIGNPWIFEQARAFLGGDAGAADRQPTIQQQRRVLLEHFELAVARRGPGRAGVLMRKFGIKFALHHPRAADVKAAFINVRSIDDWHAVLQRHYVAEPGPAVAAACA